MSLQERVGALVALGEKLQHIPGEQFELAKIRAAQVNPWFTRENIDLALDNIIKWLKKENLQEWVSKYDPEPTHVKRTGIIMAGNIPLVGFHDLLAVLISGHKAVVKTSSQDPVLVHQLINELQEISPALAEKVFFADKVKDVDAIIATGSDNTSRYFEYYFRNIPHIIRKNRTSVAVLSGNESPEELEGLAKDVFQFFGLGCRNVSKIFIPQGYDFDKLYGAFKNWDVVGRHNKFMNNYEYTQAIYLLKNIKFLDFGFILLKEDPGLFSPLGVLYFQYYNDLSEVDDFIADNKEKIQVVSSPAGFYKNSLPSGEAQVPGLSDYADNIDTLKFLSEL